MAPGGSWRIMASFKEYLEKQAARPALAPRRVAEERHCCQRCDGEVFLLSKRGEAVCAGCGAALEANLGLGEN